jgi:uncharacterized protein YaaW (UPF0174 family)
MWPIVNVFLQAGLSKAIHVVGVVGAKAATANLAGQGLIHGVAVAAGPVGWVITGATIAYGAYRAWEYFEGTE